MAVAFDAVGPSSSGAFSSGTSPLTWTHTPTGTPTAVVIGGTTFTGTTNAITAVTYGGASCTLLGFVESGTQGVSNGGIAGYIKNSPASGAQTVSETFTGGSDTIGGSMSFTGSNGNASAVTAFAANASSISISVPNTTTGGMIAAVCCFGGGLGGGTIGGTNSVTVQYNDNVSSSSASDNSAGGTVVSTGGGASQTVGFQTVGQGNSDDWGIVAVELLPAGGASAGAIPAAPGPAWRARFRGQKRKPQVLPQSGLVIVSSTGSFSLAPLAFSAQGAQTGPDQPRAQPGPFWFQLFKPFFPKPPVPKPGPFPPSANATGSFSLAPLAFAGTGAQSSPDVPQVTPGPSWFRFFKPWIPRPRPVPPSRDQVSSSGSISLAPLAFSATGAQSSPDVTQVQPGPFWLRFFKPWIPKPPVFRPDAPSIGITVTGSFTLAPLAFSAQGGQTSPDIPSVQPGPFWQRLFRPYVPKPLPPLPSRDQVSSSGSFLLAPLAFSGIGAQTSPDIPVARPGPLWQRLFRPYVPKPLPPQPARDQVSATGSFSLAPLSFSATGAQTSPDIPSLQPGTTWARLFKPWIAKPRPWIPDPTIPAAGPVATGSFALAPLVFTANGGATSPDILQVAPGPLWTRLFKPWINRPLPPVASRDQVSSTGSFTLAPLAFSAQGAQTSPDITQIQPGPMWLRLLRPWVPRPLPPLPSRDQVSSSGSFLLAPLAFTATGAQTSPDQPSVQPGPVWQRLFRPYVPKPFPPLPSTQPQTGVQATGSFALAPIAFSGQGAETAPDVLQITPGPSWLRRFKPGLQRPFPPVPALQAVSSTGSFALAPLAFSATGAQTSPDFPVIQPGPFWTRLFRPWVPKPLPPLPGRDQVSATGNILLAPLAFSATAGQTSPDIPQARPGPYWLRFFKPWIQRPVPPVPAAGPITVSGSLALAPLNFAGTGAQTSPDILQVAPGPSWMKLFRPWRKQLPWTPSAPPTNVPCSGGIALAPLAFSGHSISPAATVKYGVPHYRWGTGGPQDQWETGVIGDQWNNGSPQTQWQTGVISSEWA